jgi:nucleotide-binding universal stress UspA family protein
MTTRGTECLVYVDPAPRGAWALSLAALLPGRESLDFRLLATEKDAAAHPELLPRAAERLAGARTVQRVLRAGPPRRAVVLEAAEHPYDLVIVPPAGRNALQRLLKGSRVAAVVRGVHAPVLVARRPPSRLDRILAAVSGGAASEAVVEAASALAAGSGGHVDYLHVASEIALPFAPHGTPKAAVAPVPPDALHAAQAALARSGSSGALVVREGLVVDQVLEAFDAGAYALLVVGASADVEHPKLGREHVTERLVLGCSGSALVVPASRLRVTGGAGEHRV